ncbi:MAG: tRNA uridine-5-carboxymethylaminomethyl(34) synthesis GTPase MnmE [Desulfovibrionaceae bacterium]|nr:tRNA uridine-5-carboxymethylaminomethyl(34) synthesis GTPase MnmE [Desulfovibrionaceae bacterium]MBF0512715.1 tRNA uridine-5-carboxymethylaminomethyl(34) synthesis GTPase MnmE [Desulfovibrionaceae bacterium]
MANDTIAARATAPGAGAVAVVRVSGPAALSVLQRIFRPSLPAPETPVPRRLVHGFVVGRDLLAVDEALAVFMPGPHSYTGEDCVEIHGHGGPAVTRGVLEEVLAAGCRLAEPGEFTKRAFLNGKLDLSQAEAVAELVSAPGRFAARFALSALRGHLGGRVNALRARLGDLRTRICLAVDFPEEEEQGAGCEAFRRGVQEVLDEIVNLLADCSRAGPLREGALVVLAGPVNAGKSSLLNALIGRDRALVSAVAGTTRDYLEESVDLGGLCARLADTAGLRESVCGIERLGMDKSLELMDAADLVVLAFDRSAAASADDAAQIIRTAQRRGPSRTLVAANKIDLEPCSAGSAGAPDPAARLRELGFEIAAVSAKTGEGLEALVAAMRARILSGGEPPPDAAVPNLRQAGALEEAGRELAALLEDEAAGLPADCLGVRLETACAALCEITGAITPEGVLDAVFSRFCIGK